MLGDSVPHKLKHRVSQSSSIPKPYRDVQFKHILRTAWASAALTFPMGVALAVNKSSVSMISRAEETDSEAWEPGLLANEIYYPGWLEGQWTTNSTCTGIVAPLGIEAFGGQRAFNNAKRDINQWLIYTTRFVREASDDQKIVADRVYNVESIAKSAMGADSVLPFQQPDSNVARRLHLAASPPGGDIVDVDLIPTDRLFRFSSETTFECMERTAQLISTRINQLSPNPPPPARKDIETITNYRFVDTNTIEAIQRTATFLTPADSRFAKLERIEPSIGTRALDVRFYHIIYSRIN